MESGVKRYFMIDKVFFDSLFDLISHYQAGCTSISFNIVLLFTAEKNFVYQSVLLQNVASRNVNGT
jgi:hypothetical protein